MWRPATAAAVATAFTVSATAQQHNVHPRVVHYRRPAGLHPDSEAPLPQPDGAGLSQLLLTQSKVGTDLRDLEQLQEMGLPDMAKELLQMANEKLGRVTNMARRDKFGKTVLDLQKQTNTMLDDHDAGVNVERNGKVRDLIQTATGLFVKLDVELGLQGVLEVVLLPDKTEPAYEGRIANVEECPDDMGTCTIKVVDVADDGTTPWPCDRLTVLRPGDTIIFRGLSDVAHGAVYSGMPARFIKRERDENRIRVEAVRGAIATQFSVAGNDYLAIVPGMKVVLAGITKDVSYNGHIGEVVTCIYDPTEDTKYEILVGGKTRVTFASKYLEGLLPGGGVILHGFTSGCNASAGHPLQDAVGTDGLEEFDTSFNGMTGRFSRLEQNGKIRVNIVGSQSKNETSRSIPGENLLAIVSGVTVFLAGMTGEHSSLNGRMGSVVEHSFAQPPEYVVKIAIDAEDKKIGHLKVENLRGPLRDHVIIHGLAKRADLNGRTGDVVKRLADGRYEVKVTGGQKKTGMSASIQGKNLLAIVNGVTVFLAGLTGEHSSLNGMMGSVVEYSTAQPPEYVVKIDIGAEDKEIGHLKAENLRHLFPRDDVIIHGLTNRTDLNGRTGTVVKRLADGRYEVKVAGGQNKTGTSASIRGKNLLAIVTGVGLDIVKDDKIDERLAGEVVKRIDDPDCTNYKYEIKLTEGGDNPRVEGKKLRWPPTSV